MADQLTDFDIVGVDLRQPTKPAVVAHFEELDLAEERSCDQLLGLMRRYRPEAVVHLAWVAAPLRPSPEERKRIWQTNVAGTGRVLEAIAEHNRRFGGLDRFIYPSSFWVYGPVSGTAAREDSALQPQTFYQALDKLEADATVQTRSRTLGNCRTYILRAAIYAGEVSGSHLLTLLSGAPDGTGWRAKRARRKHSSLPLWVPREAQVMGQSYQFIHIDDMARLIAFLLHRTTSDPKLTIMNVAAKGDPLTLQRITDIVGLKIRRLPFAWLRDLILNLRYTTGLSQVPSEAHLFGSGSYLMDTSRLRGFLGDNFKEVIRHSSEGALRSSLARRSHDHGPLPDAAK